MISDIIALAKKFIAVSSTADNNGSLAEILKIARDELGEFPSTQFDSNNIPSLLFSNHEKDRMNFKIILNAHLDVIPGNKEQFQPYEKDGKLYGRGAYDMKSAAAAMILLFKEISKKIDYPLGLQLTTDEESGGANGTGYQVKKGIRADFIITGEGTNFRIIHEAKSRYVLKLTAQGKSSHGAYPWLGENAVWKMQQAVSALYEKYPLPKTESADTTLNITSISTDNTTLNRTPDHCEAILDIRAIPVEHHTIINTIRKIVPTEIDMEVLLRSEPHTTAPDNPFIKQLQSHAQKTLNMELILARAHGASDMPYYSEVGCEGIEFGPIGGGHHSADEWLDIKSLENYAIILYEFLLNP